MIALKNAHLLPIDVDRSGRRGRPLATGAKNGSSAHLGSIPEKALTIKRPWAWAIAAGIKGVENRCWRTRFRGLLAIHAGLGICAGRELLEQLGHVVPPYEEMPAKAFIAVVRVVDCVPVSEVKDDPLAFGPWCWMLEDVRVLSAPVPCGGMQSLWNVPRNLRRFLAA